MAKFLFWSGIFLVLLLAADQFLVRLPEGTPGLGTVGRFYVDFRGRLAGLVTGEEPPAAVRNKPSVARKIEAAAEQPASGPRYIYVDGEGQLHFADSLEEIPAPHRSQAQPLSQ